MYELSYYNSRLTAHGRRDLPPPGTHGKFIVFAVRTTPIILCAAPPGLQRVLSRKHLVTVLSDGPAPAHAHCADVRSARMHHPPGTPRCAAQRTQAARAGRSRCGLVPSC